MSTRDRMGTPAKGQDFGDSQEDRCEELDTIIGATVRFPGLKMES